MNPTLTRPTVPSYIISNEISKKYKVAISGDGGDELLGGYLRTNELMMPKRKLLNFLNYFDVFYLQIFFHRE